MPPKIRPVKKPAKNPVNIIVQGDLLSTLLLRNRNVLLIGLGLILFGAVTGVVLWQVSHQAEKKAWALEAEASRLYYEDPALKAALEKSETVDTDAHYKEAMEQYQHIVNKYPKTTAAPIAQFYIGNIQFELDNKDGAIEAYLEFLKTTPSTHRLTPLVQTKLAYTYQQNNNETDALKVFQIVMGDSQAYNQDQAYYEVGRIYEAMEVTSEAIAAFEKTSEKFEDSSWALEAQARLSVLRPDKVPPSTEQIASTPAAPIAPVATSGVSAPGATVSTIKIRKNEDGTISLVPPEEGGEMPSSHPQLPANMVIGPPKTEENKPKK